MWFDDWQTIFQIILKAAIGFAAIVALVRVSGKRTLAKFNAFDMVLVFTIGSVLATMILDNGTTVSEGLAALCAIVALQFATAFLTVRFGAVRRIVKSDPTLLVYDGEYLRDAMRKARVAEIEVLAALREQGVHDLAEVKAMVLETEGRVSVLKRGDGDPSRSLRISGIDLPGASSR